MKEIQKTKTHKLLSKIYWKLFNLTNGENKRVKHNLNKDSIVFDMGAYVGNYVESIYKRYGCNVYAFEPVERFYKILKLRFENDEKIKIFNSGFDIEEMTKFISEDGDGSSLYTNENKVLAKFIVFEDFLKENLIEKIDLLEMNIEGSEYDILPHIISSGTIKKISILQIQFHDNIDNWKSMKKEIVKELKKTHKKKWGYPYVFDCWVLK